MSRQNIIVAPQARMRVAAYDVNSKLLGRDASDANFVITADTPGVPDLTLLSPQGGEHWSAGSTQQIKWTVGGDTSQIDHFFVEYSLNDQASYSTLAVNPGKAERSLYWTVPNSPTTAGVVRLSACDSTGKVLKSGINGLDFIITALPSKAVAVPDVSNNAPTSGTPVTFHGENSKASTGATISSYSWDFGDGGSSNIATPSHTYTSAAGATSYTAKLTVTDSAGLSDTKSLAITVTGKALGTNTQQSLSADPVNLATGNYTYEHVDLKIRGSGIPFEFRRSYNSKDAHFTGAPLGQKWTHSYNIVLQDNGANAIITFGDEHSETYAQQGDGTYKGEAGVFSILTKNGTFTLTTKEQLKYAFDNQNRLASISDKNGNTLTLTYGSSGYLASITDTVGRVINFTTDAGGFITQITDPIGRTIKFTYANGDLATATDANGGVTQFDYDGDHQLVDAIDGRGNKFVQNTYDNLNRVVSAQKDAIGNQTLFDYDFVTRVTTLTDAVGNKSYHKHDDKLRVVSITDANGHTEFYDYDQSNNRTKVTDRRGAVTTYSYDDRGNVTGKTDALANKTVIQYDVLNNPVLRKDAMGRTTKFTYDAKGNLLTAINAFGKVSSQIAYDTHGLPISVTDGNGHLAAKTYDAQANLIDVSDPLGNTSTYAYDGMGRRLSETDANGHTRTFTYDGNDNVLTVTDALTHKVTNAYDANSNKISVKDARGNVTQFTYDPKDRLTDVTNALSQTVHYDYDGVDRKIKITDARGTITHNTYDAVGNLVKVDVLSNNALLSETMFSYDANGNKTSVTDPNGNRSWFVYDALNRLVMTSDPLGDITTTAYDDGGERISATDANGHPTSFSYDAIGRLVRVTDAKGGVVKYGYDNAGNRTSVTDPNGHVTTFIYDASNRLAQKNEPLSATYKYGYDSAGNRVSMTDANGHTITYTFDAGNQLASIHYPSGTPVTFSYDENGNRTQMTDGLGTASWQFDVLNRMTSSTDSFGNTISYGYDENGNKISLTYPGNKTVNYTYDGLNRMVSVTDWQSRQVVYTYDAVGNVLTGTNPNGTSATYSYDTDNRLVGLLNSGTGGSIISQYALTLDPAGNHRQVVQDEPLEPIIPKETVNYTYDKDNRLIQAGSTHFGYDANGNMVARGADTFSYDSENRLIQVTVGGATSQYQYDGMGSRRAASNTAGTERFVLDTSGALSRVLAETDESNTVKAYYIYGRGLVSRIAANGTTALYYHCDVRGSTIALSNSSAVVTDQYAYDSYGRIANSQGTTANPFKYVGKYGVMDEGNGLDYVRARYYNSGIGRFISKDPLNGLDGDSQSLERYVYALNNPIRRIDISGYYSITDFWNDAKELGGSVVQGVVQDVGTAIVDSAHFALKNGYRSIPEFEGAVQGGIKETVGGTNLLVSAGGAFIEAALAFGENKLLDAVEGPAKHVPGVTWVPIVGDILDIALRYHEAGGDLPPGYSLDNAGNVLDASGKVVEKSANAQNVPIIPEAIEVNANKTQTYKK